MKTPTVVLDATSHRKRRTLRAVDVSAISSAEQSMDSVADHCEFEEKVEKSISVTQTKHIFHSLVDHSM